MKKKGKGLTDAPRSEYDNMIWQNKTVVFLDLETTGLTPGQDRTVEIGALKTKNRKEGRIICNIKRGKTEREIL